MKTDIEKLIELLDGFGVDNSKLGGKIVSIDEGDGYDFHCNFIFDEDGKFIFHEQLDYDKYTDEGELC